MAQTKKGALKTSAKKAGLSLDEYINKINNGYKKCGICERWLIKGMFVKDISRYDNLNTKCKECNKALWREASINKKKRKDMVCGNKKKARARINTDVETGIRPSPNKLFCSLCGHIGNDLRHEYHHPLGYSKEHQNDTIPLCSKCHHEQHQE